MNPTLSGGPKAPATPQLPTEYATSSHEKTPNTAAVGTQGNPSTEGSINPTGVDWGSTNNQWMYKNDQAAPGKGWHVNNNYAQGTYSTLPSYDLDRMPAGKEGWWGTISQFIPMLDSFVFNRNPPANTGNIGDKIRTNQQLNAAEGQLMYGGQ